MIRIDINYMSFIFSDIDAYFITACTSLTYLIMTVAVNTLPRFASLCLFNVDRL